MSSKLYNLTSIDNNKKLFIYDSDQFKEVSNTFSKTKDFLYLMNAKKGTYISETKYVSLITINKDKTLSLKNLYRSTSKNSYPSFILFNPHLYSVSISAYYDNVGLFDFYNNERHFYYFNRDLELRTNNRLYLSTDRSIICSSKYQKNANFEKVIINIAGNPPSDIYSNDKYNYTFMNSIKVDASNPKVINSYKIDENGSIIKSPPNQGQQFNQMYTLIREPSYNYTITVNSLYYVSNLNNLVISELSRHNNLLAYVSSPNDTNTPRYLFEYANATIKSYRQECVVFCTTGNMCLNRSCINIMEKDCIGELEAFEDVYVCKIKKDKEPPNKPNESDTPVTKPIEDIPLFPVTPVEENESTFNIYITILIYFIIFAVISWILYKIFF